MKDSRDRKRLPQSESAIRKSYISKAYTCRTPRAMKRPWTITLATGEPPLQVDENLEFPNRSRRWINHVTYGDSRSQAAEALQKKMNKNVALRLWNPSRGSIKIKLIRLLKAREWNPYLSTEGSLSWRTRPFQVWVLNYGPSIALLWGSLGLLWWTKGNPMTCAFVPLKFHFFLQKNMYWMLEDLQEDSQVWSIA